MDLKNWSFDQLMMLPDCCFGTRWPIGVAVVGAVVSPKFDIAEMPLPERCIIWELAALYHEETLLKAQFELRLGDTLPLTWAAFQEYELLFKGVRTLAAPGGPIYIVSTMSVNWQNFKLPVAAAGRRLVIGVDAGQAVNNTVQAVVTVSSIPREVPDCLLSV